MAVDCQLLSVVDLATVAHDEWDSSLNLAVEPHDRVVQVRAIVAIVDPRNHTRARVDIAGGKAGDLPGAVGGRSEAKNVSRAGTRALADTVPSRRHQIRAYQPRRTV